MLNSLDFLVYLFLYILINILFQSMITLSRRLRDQIQEGDKGVPLAIIQSQGEQSNFFLSVRESGGYKATTVTQPF